MGGTLGSSGIVGCALLVCSQILGYSIGHASDPSIITLRAIENPDSKEAIDAYLSLHPKMGDAHFVIDGDLRFTREEVVEYLREIRASKIDRARRSLGEDAAELKVALDPAGALSYWRLPESREITYSIDYQSFERLGLEVAEKSLSSLKAAAKDWEQVCAECQIRFSYRPPASAGLGFREVVFVLRFGGENPLLADAFFPYQYLSTKQPQSLTLYAGFFRTREFSRIGILRHELGHILGYRHEHAGGVPGCVFEDRRWRSLTPRDSTSVMHYPCGGGGNKFFAISTSDVEAHKCLYLRSGECSR